MFVKEKLNLIWKSRLLIQSLVSRDLKARYRGSVLGFLWSFFNPMLLMLVYTIAFGVILRPRYPIEELNSPVFYSLFLFSGLLPWIWFSSAIIEAMNVLQIHGSLIKKVMFPVDVLPISVVTANLVNFLLGIPILVLFFVVLGKGLSWWALTAVYPMIVQFLFTLGIAFFVSALTVHFKDMINIITNLLTLWFFATPIIYPFEFEPILKSKLIKTALLINPMTHIIEGYQYAFFFGKLLHWKKLGVTFIVSLVVFWGGYYFFDRLKDTFPEEV